VQVTRQEGGDERESLLNVAMALLNVAVTTSSILRGMFKTNEKPCLFSHRNLGKAQKVTTSGVTSHDLAPG
jgi:hypothetical protein